ncbi:MAG: hypothetical protein ABH871_06705 [Pseudomonadota bacterium]
MRKAAIYALGDIAPRLEPADRQQIALRIETRLNDEGTMVREAATKVLRKMRHN